MTTPKTTVICFDCEYYLGKPKKECKAFKEIPDFIWFGCKHDKIVKGQKGKYIYKVKK